MNNLTKGRATSMAWCLFQALTKPVPSIVRLLGCLVLLDSAPDLLHFDKLQGFPNSSFCQFSHMLHRRRVQKIDLPSRQTFHVVRRIWFLWACTNTRRVLVYLEIVLFSKVSCIGKYRRHSAHDNEICKKMNSSSSAIGDLELKCWSVTFV